jgi:hypothetical protein
VTLLMPELCEEFSWGMDRERNSFAEEGIWNTKWTVIGTIVSRFTASFVIE